MENNINTISISELENAICDELNDNTMSIEWRGLSIVLKRRLSVRELMGFSQSVIDNCISKSDGRYVPEVFDFIVNNNIIEFYTNISLPEDIEERYSVVLSCRQLIDVIKDSIDSLQFDELINAIRSRLYYESRTNIDAILEKADSARDDIESMSSMLSNMLDGIDADTFKDIMKIVSSGDIDEAKIMDAYLSHIESGKDG